MVIVELPHHPYVSTNCVWHPDGRSVAVLCNDLRIHFWETAAVKKTHVLSGLVNGGVQFSFNHAGDMLATTGWESKLRLWDPRTGQQLFSTTVGVAGNVRFSTDDKNLAVVKAPEGKLASGKSPPVRSGTPSTRQSPPCWQWTLSVS